MKAFRLLLALLGVALALPASAQQFLWSADFDLNFDNREYAELSIPSQTLFGARLTPQIGMGWGGTQHALMIGTDITKTFGRDTRFCENPELMLYYAYRSRKLFDATAGIFPRKMLMGDYSGAIASDSVRFYDKNIEGLLFQYRGYGGFVELGIDWDGLYSVEEREKFRIFSAGEYRRRVFTCGYTLSVYHYAGRVGIPGVVDNIAVQPFVGAKLEHLLPLDRLSLTASWIQTYQWDRRSGNKCVFPYGGEVRLRLEKWHVGIDNRLYIGNNLMPYFARYGGDLYAGERFYAMENGTSKIYNRTELYYNHTWWSDAVPVSLHAGISLHFIAGKVVTSQLVQLNVAIDSRRLKLNRKNKDN